ARGNAHALWSCDRGQVVSSAADDATDDSAHAAARNASWDATGHACIHWGFFVFDHRYLLRDLSRLAQNLIVHFHNSVDGLNRGRWWRWRWRRWGHQESCQLTLRQSFRVDQRDQDHDSQRNDLQDERQGGRKP